MSGHPIHVETGCWCETDPNGCQYAGEPCHFCGATYTTDMCRACWTSVDDLPLADLKALFALGDLSISTPETGERSA